VIASVAFRNFKALRSADLRLTPFNLVVGPNGSGKTSLIEAVLRLRALARLPLAEGSAVEAAAPPALRPALPSSMADGAVRAGMAPEVLAREGPEIVFGFSPPHQEVEARISCLSDVVCDLLRVRAPNPAAWSAVQEKLERMRGYLWDHYAMAAPAPLAQGRELNSNGANLAAVLAERRRRDPDAYGRWEAEAVRVLPEFTGFTFRAATADTVELFGQYGDTGHQVSAENLSQGTLYTLAFLTLAFDPDPPALVCCEEIDRGIHPRGLREIRDALYRLSHPSAFGESRPAVQVIATSHSPYVLDLFRDHPEDVVITQKVGRQARFERLTERPDAAELLREGSLGDMWFSGILGGVPEEPSA
jgi:predicted ATPase